MGCQTLNPQQKTTSSHPSQRLSTGDFTPSLKQSQTAEASRFNMLKDRGNPFCSKFGWGGLAILIFAGFSYGYAFSRKNFTAHRKGLIIAGSVALGIICVGIITAVVIRERRKKAAARDEENLVVRPPAYEPPMTADRHSSQPPITANQNNSPRDASSDPQQGADHHSDEQHNDPDGLPEKPPPAYSERLGDRVGDPNPSSMLNV